MPIPEDVQNAVLAWIQANDVDVPAQQDLVNALRNWQGSDGQDVVYGLAPSSHELLSELQRLGQRSMEVLLVRLYEDKGRMHGIRKAVEREANRVGTPSEVTNSVHSIITAILKRSKPAISDFQRPEDLDAYIITSCRNAIRKHKKKSNHLSPFHQNEVTDHAVDPQPTPLEAVTSDDEIRASLQRVAHIHHAVSSMPPTPRAILTLCLDCQWSFADLAHAFPEEGCAKPMSAKDHGRRAQQIRRMVIDFKLKVVEEMSETGA